MKTAFLCALHSKSLEPNHVNQSNFQDTKALLTLSLHPLYFVCVLQSQIRNSAQCIDFPTRL